MIGEGIGEPSARTDSARRQYMLLGLIVLIGAALRVHGLAAQGYWMDEIAMIDLAGGDAGRIVDDFRENYRPPVYVWLARGWLHLFGPTEIATRSLSAIIGIAAIPMMFLVGRTLFGPAVGLISAFLLAVSTAQIAQAQSFRYYSLLVLLTLVSFFFYLRVLRVGRSRDFVFWAASGVLLFHTHHFGVFALAAQTLHAPFALWRHRDRWMYWCLAQVVMYAGPAIQLLVPLAERVVQGQPPPGPLWIPPATWADVRWTYKDFLFDVSRSRLALTAIVTMALGVLIGRARGGRRWISTSLARLLTDLRATRQRRELVLVLLWVLLPVVCPFVLSMLLKPMFVSRYTLPAAPALYLLIAFAIWTIRSMMPPAVAVAAFCALAGMGLHNYHAVPRHEQVREAAALVSAEQRPGDAILMARHDGRPAFAQEPRERLWDWYYRGHLPRCDRQEPIVDIDALRGAVERCLTEHQRVWLVLARVGFPRDFVDVLTHDDTQRSLHRTWLIEEHNVHWIELYVISRRVPATTGRGEIPAAASARGRGTGAVTGLGKGATIPTL